MSLIIYYALKFVVVGIAGITVLAAVQFGKTRLVGIAAESHLRRTRAIRERGASLVETAMILGILCVIGFAAVPMLGKATPEVVCQVMWGFGENLALDVSDPLFFDQESGAWWCPVVREDDDYNRYYVDAFTGTVID